MKFLTMQFSARCSCLITLTPKHLPQHPFLSHSLQLTTNPMLLLQQVPPPQTTLISILGIVSWFAFQGHSIGIQVFWNATPSRLVFTDVTYWGHYASPKRRWLSTRRSITEELTFRHHDFEDLQSRIFSVLPKQRTHQTYVLWVVSDLKRVASDSSTWVFSCKRTPCIRTADWTRVYV